MVLKWFDVCKDTLSDWFLSSSYEKVLRPLYLHIYLFFGCTSRYFLLFNLLQDSEPDVIDGVGAETGHVIRTTVGGRNGQAKQVESISNCRI